MGQTDLRKVEASMAALSKKAKGPRCIEWDVSSLPALQTKGQHYSPPFKLARNVLGHLRFDPGCGQDEFCGLYLHASAAAIVHVKVSLDDDKPMAIEFNYAGAEYRGCPFFAKKKDSYSKICLTIVDVAVTEGSLTHRF